MKRKAPSNGGFFELQPLNAKGIYTINGQTYTATVPSTKKQGVHRGLGSHSNEHRDLI